MTNCAKCGAELIGSRRFCSACGAPAIDPRAVTAPDPRASTAPAHGSVVDPRAATAPASDGIAPPSSAVNPLAATAIPRDSSYGPPPASPISPLAISNVVRESDLVAAQRVAGAKVKAKGTELLPASRLPPGAVVKPPVPSAPSASSSRPKPPPGTQIMAPIAPPGAVPTAKGHGQLVAPGARVQVTWANGQRYPATVQQTSGGKCLVVFPDGQQRWVDLQYVTLG